jgi:hypothetical protein
MFLYRLTFQLPGMILSTRESAATRRELLKLGISQISAGSRTDVGALGWILLLVGWIGLVGWLVGWLDSFVGWLVGWLVRWFGWSINWLCACTCAWLVSSESYVFCMCASALFPSRLPTN